jgi:hypothetical protein
MGKTTMNNPDVGQDDFDAEDRTSTDRPTSKFKKLKRPIHSAKRSKSPERLRGIHRRRRRRLEW